MKIGDFFINLGFKGTDKAVKEAQSIKNTLGEVSTQGLAAKAAILGMVYGLERLMMNSAQTGQNLMSFSNATGLSLESLQRWQYAAAQAGVSAEEMEGSIIHMQAAMMEVQKGANLPSGWGAIHVMTGLDARDKPEEALKKMVQYAQQEKNVAWANSNLTSMGWSLDMIAAARQGVFNQKNFSTAPIYSDREAQHLQKIRVGWSNLYRQFEMAMGHLNAKHGEALIKALSDVSTEVINLANALARLAENDKVLQGLKSTLEGIVTALRYINGDSIDKVADEQLAKNKDFGSVAGLNWAIDAFSKTQMPSVEKAIPRTMRDPVRSENPHNTTNIFNMQNHLIGVPDGQNAGKALKQEIDRGGRAPKLKARGQ